MILSAFHPFLSKCLCAVLKWQSEGEGDFGGAGAGGWCHSCLHSRKISLLHSGYGKSGGHSRGRNE